jgi:hypothetical protein
MSKANRCRPRLEVLEDRTPPASLSLTAPLAPLGVAHQGPHSHRLRLKGQLSGFWATQPTLPDVGARQSLTGSGTVQPLGFTHAIGNLQMPGFVVTGRVHGTLTLSGAQGRIALDLVSDPMKGFGSAPTRWTYTITGGTAKFAGASGTGRATLREVTPPPCPPGLYCAQIAPHFTLAF